MTTFEKRSDGATYDDRDSHHGRDSHQERVGHQERDSHQQHGGLGMAENLVSVWTGAIYDYAEQVLRAQRQFAHSMLGAAAPMRNVVRDMTSADTTQDRSANNQLDARGDQRHDGSQRSHERYNDDETAEHNRRSVDNNRSDDNTSDISGSERAKTQAGQSAKTQTPVTANTTDRMLR
jgi:hypothetical protein